MVVVLDPDFQVPGVTGTSFSFDPPGTAWSYQNYAGVCGAGGPFCPAGTGPTGFVQAGFLACNWAASGSPITASVSQSIDFGGGGVFSVLGWACQSPSFSGGQLLVLLDGLLLAALNPGSAWASWQTREVTVSPGSHLVTLQVLSDPNPRALGLVGISVNAAAPALTVAMPPRWSPPRGRR